MSTFFGLQIEDRPIIFGEIHDLCYFGNGGFTPDIVYNMPVWLRKFHINKIIEYNKPKESNDLNEATNNKILSPNITKSDYNTITSKAPKK